ncbi:MAG: hypothetical protein ISN64_01960 [Rickettsia sp.]|nr:hypothetical protein [Rickettsia sp.]
MQIFITIYRFRKKSGILFGAKLLEKLKQLLDPFAEQNEGENSRQIDINENFKKWEKQNLLSKLPKDWGLILQVNYHKKIFK